MKASIVWARLAGLFFWLVINNAKAYSKFSTSGGSFFHRLSFFEPRHYDGVFEYNKKATNPVALKQLVLFSLFTYPVHVVKNKSLGDFFTKHLSYLVYSRTAVIQ